MESWEDKFYRLADVYIEQAVLFKYTCGRLGLTENEIQEIVYKDLTQKQVEHMHEVPRLKVAGVIQEPEEKPEPSKKSIANASTIAFAAESRKRKRKKAAEPIPVDDGVFF